MVNQFVGLMMPSTHGTSSLCAKGEEGIESDKASVTRARKIVDCLIMISASCKRERGRERVGRGRGKRERERGCGIQCVSAVNMVYTV